MFSKHEAIYAILLGASSVFAASSASTTATTASSSTSTTSTTSTTSGITTHTVAAGQNGFSFNPGSLTAQVGDVIEFQFYPTNHSVGRSAYKSPCIPLQLTGDGSVGFWSGFKPTATISDDLPSYQVTINDTDPVFFYCSAPGACTQDGMVGVINPTTDETLQVQREFALNSTLELSPGENFPAEGVTSTSSSSTATSTSTSSSTSSAASGGSSGSSLSAGAIAGIAVGGAAVVIIAAALIWMCGRQKTMGELLRAHPQSVGAPPVGYIPGPTMSPDQGSRGTHSVYSGRRPDGNTGYGFGGAYNGYRDPFENDSYRSRSPPMDEQLPPFPSPDNYARQEMADGSYAHYRDGPSPPKQPPTPVELPATSIASPQPTPPYRKFSFIEGDKGYAQGSRSPKGFNG